MPKTTISCSDTGYFSKLMCDYLAEKDTLASFYGNFPMLENFQKQITEKKNSFSAQSRAVLVQALHKQYATTDASEATLANIESLSNSNTFTVTTGHQLNLFTGPLYFLYKIFSVINLSEELKEKHPESHFVPVYWMATEDHDFDEINYFNLFGKKIAWNRESGGAVGELSTEGLSEVLKQFEAALGASNNAKKMTALFSEAYTKHTNLTEATRYLGNQLFSEYGLVIVDGNDALLKKAFVPFAKKELLEQLSHRIITETTTRLTALGYPEQVHPREINLFYLAEGIRERIIKKDGMYYVNDTDLSFTEAEILSKLDANPECFSPNALLRPLYQEVILPNLCYTGGGGELAYWFQLKDYFEAVEVPFPILLLRNSVLLLPTLLSEKLEKLEVSIDDLFLKQPDLRTKYTRQLSGIKIDFSEQKEFLKKQFEALHELAKKTDASFIGAVEAQEKKQINGLSNLEKRLLKAQKRNLAAALDRLTAIQDELFPKQSLQERTVNFSEYYLEYGDVLLQELKKELRPLDPNFTILSL
ncbi:bacillithiol biosynthesis cysteine-adding enzyme BshC [Ulvibacter litoralis]|uniref:Putative cysteine ligase BshC n=1 Tax=Ulvibacter litoralis TaxID=227084 RepID=A0A1G7IT56_9FLAO|nr:bacillithiol biosynthesis cysteine-adding enzyme BshC [Ulvibacter litoralis]GHC63208.1 putative cysteine ligase BshC [Ulvibacter litoralis]SDF15853.1 bacillithiol biosynthesis cysteine-adding enzyme BshC [Ulvibacter litoralis]